MIVVHAVQTTNGERSPIIRPIIGAGFSSLGSALALIIAGYRFDASSNLETGVNVKRPR